MFHTVGIMYDPFLHTAEQYRWVGTGPQSKNRHITKVSEVQTIPALSTNNTWRFH